MRRPAICLAFGTLLLVTLAAREKVLNSVEYLGLILIGLGRFLRGRATYRRVDLLNAVQQA
jgi:hypothetical protein